MILFASIAGGAAEVYGLLLAIPVAGAQEILANEVFLAAGEGLGTRAGEGHPADRGPRVDGASMITRLTGTLEAMEGLAAVVTPGGGVSYQVLVPAFVAVAGLRERVGRPVTLHTIQAPGGQGPGDAMIPRLIGFSTAGGAAVLWSARRAWTGWGTARRCAGPGARADRAGDCGGGCVVADEMGSVEDGGEDLEAEGQGLDVPHGRRRRRADAGAGRRTRRRRRLGRRSHSARRGRMRSGWCGQTAGEEAGDWRHRTRSWRRRSGRDGGGVGELWPLRSGGPGGDA